MVRGSPAALKLSYRMKDDSPKAERDGAMRNIASAMTRHAGDVTKTAKELGVGRATLHRWIVKYPYLLKSLEHARRHGPA